MNRYKELKQKQSDGRRDRRIELLASEKEYIDRVESIVGYEVMLHLPYKSKFILGADDAEAILDRIAPAAW